MQFSTSEGITKDFKTTNRYAIRLGQNSRLGTSVELGKLPKYYMAVIPI